MTRHQPRDPQPGLTPPLGFSERPGRLLAAGILLVAALLGTSVVSPTTARADSVATAQARVDALQRLARDTTAKLTSGTRAWESDQARLRTLRLDLGNTRRRITTAQARLDAEQAQVDGLVRSLYMRPAATELQLAMTQTPDEVLSSLQSRQSLDVAAGTQGDVLARAVSARHELRRQEADARALVADAARLAASSAARLVELNTLADRTSGQLTAAQDTLRRALAQRAAALARAARDRASRSRAAARLTVSVPTGPACTGQSTAGQANGNLDPGSLCPLWEAPGNMLRADAAKAFNAMSQYHARTTGSPLCVTDSYRSYAEQVSVYHRKPGLAAVPGTSEHGWGLATDLCGGVQTFGSSAYQWMTANAARFRFGHPAWAEPSGSKPEPWHWEFAG